MLTRLNEMAETIMSGMIVAYVTIPIRGLFTPTAGGQNFFPLFRNCGAAAEVLDVASPGH